MSENDERRQRDQAPPSPNKENFEIDVPPSGAINISSNPPPASSSLGWEIKMPSSVAAASTATTTSVRTFGMRLPSDPERRVDPLETVIYESWMFLETAQLALDHLDGLPSAVIQHAIVEDAVLHARSLCEVIVGPHKKDTISLRELFPDLKTDREKYKALMANRKLLEKEYTKENGKQCSYKDLFNTRVMHPTVLRGDGGLYAEPLRRLQPKILAVVREIARLKELSFQLASGEVIGSSPGDTK